MKRVFISSTIFDLIDVRAEIERELREMRLIPVLSGSATSGFQPLPDQNSIETCLANLRQCDSVIVILCRRYGPSLKKCGFPDVSATHHEYNEARKLGKPIHMYVRDRLEADYSIHKKNKRGEVNYIWARSEEDRRLFELLEQHAALAKGKPGSNWFETFQDSMQLKTLIRRDFMAIASHGELKNLVVENRVPILTLSLDKPDSFSAGMRITDIRFRNVGSAPAYSLTWRIDGNQNKLHKTPILAPQQEINQMIGFEFNGNKWVASIGVTYYLSQGHCVNDAHRVEVRRLYDGNFACGASLQSKSYQPATGEFQPFTIAESK